MQIPQHLNISSRFIYDSFVASYQLFSFNKKMMTRAFNKKSLNAQQLMCALLYQQISLLNI